MKLVANPLFVPLWEIHAVTLVAAHVLFFALNKATSIPGSVLGLAAAALQLTLPLLVDTTPGFPLLIVTVMFMSMLSALRLMDVATVPSATSKAWSFPEYVEYCLTLDTKPMRDYRQAQLVKRASQATGGRTARRFLERQVPPEKRNAVYYANLTMWIAAQWIAYNICIYYMEFGPFERNPPLMQPFNFARISLKNLADVLAPTLTICIVLNLSYVFCFHAIVELFRIPYNPMMDNPFISSSFRDFWSVRWNMLVKQTLHRLTFEPTMKFLSLFSGPRNRDSSKDVRPPAWHAAVAAFNAFIFSGLMHEWLIFALMDIPTTGEQMVFFLIHGVVTVGQVVVVLGIPRKWKLRSAIDNMPLPVAMLITDILMIWFAPFFLNPYVRSEFLTKISRLPTVF
ncbi:hypothetical protein HK105_204019 [Polyrhizophydium stewartii]|uniref:Wax synthase domain-containing protein n=1 Tax=Polyrhizophydium stewartii TaxID=2732419 RepID=A0ABR4NAN5_9FUNG